MSLKIKLLKRREKIITWLIAIVVALALFISFIVAIKNKTNTPSKEIVESRMSLDVQYWSFYLGYTMPVITVKNINNIAWSDCKIMINDKYTLGIEDIPSSNNSPAVMIINTNDFIDQNNIAIDLATNPVQSACIICKQPFYNSYCGNFDL
jgi:hypothetical protein